MRADAVLLARGLSILDIILPGVLPVITNQLRDCVRMIRCFGRLFDRPTATVGQPLGDNLVIPLVGFGGAEGAQVEHACRSA